jgi:choline dehydrogenase
LSNSVATDLVRTGINAAPPKFGRDAMSVVDGRLKVHGIDGLRIADASIMPRVTTGNTMAPCVVIGEHSAALLRQEREH